MQKEDKLYYYFVSYQTSTAFGRIRITMNAPIRDIADIDEIEQVISKQTGLTGVVVMYYCSFDE